MASEVVMPQMGADMQEGTLLQWLKKVGDPIQRGEVIAEIETDKANVEIEAFASGVLRLVLASEGDVVPVGEVIALIAAPDEDISPWEVKAKAGRRGPAAAPPGQPSAVPERAAARRDGGGGPPAAEGERVRISPIARRIAEEHGLDVSAIRGSGPEGRIVRRDVEAYLQQRGMAVAEPVVAAPAEQPAPAPPSAERPPAPAAGVLEMSRMRRTIARRMSQSKREAPHFYVTSSIDMTEAMRLREQANAALSEEERVSVNDLIIKACALVLEQMPRFNAHYVEDNIVLQERINISLGIALEDGLIAPAILDCRGKPLRSIAREAKDLIRRAKGGALRPDEYGAGTFTITNLGMYGVETLIGIINPPQVAILGVGTVEPRPVVREGEVVVRQMMQVALSGDHRALDGAQGGEFLAALRRVLETPVLLLL